MSRLRAAVAILPFALISSTAWAQNVLPSFVVTGTLSHADYDGVTNDLLTAGLGTSGINSAIAPAYANPNSPTVAELRRNTIYTNYRGLVDMAAGGGYQVLWGPNLNANYVDTGTQGLVAGREYLALADDGSGTNLQTVMVQIPASFNTLSPCLVTGPSSGSRNVYGAISTTGEWAFRNGCAVAYTDKGTGSYFHDLTQDTVYDFHGVLGSRSSIGALTGFAAPMTPDTLAFAASHPSRLAYKQSHSTKNGQANWGFFTLQAIQFGFYAINDYLGGGTARFNATNTIVIGAGVSNGGGSVLRAAEQDVTRLIRGIVVDEPNVEPTPSTAFTINYNGTVFANHSLPLEDYYTLKEVYAPCAALAASLVGTALQSLDPAGTPAGVTVRANRCASLKDKGLLVSTTTAAQANEALGILNAYGFLTEENALFPAEVYLGAIKQIINTYPSDAGRFRVQDNLCGISFAATDASNHPTTLTATAAANLWVAGNLPPASGINIINDNAVEGSILEQAGTSPSTGRQDLNLDGDLCYRSLVVGQPPSGIRYNLRDRVNTQRTRQGIAAQLASGNLHGLPTLILQGRSDDILAPNHTGRAYFGLNHVVEGANSNVRYIEVTNAQHLDNAINTFSPGGVPAFVPLHHYYTVALDAMLAYLRSGTPLPPSQVIHTTPRGSTAFTSANYKSFLPDIATVPASPITFTNNAVRYPAVRGDAPCNR